MFEKSLNFKFHENPPVGTVLFLAEGYTGLFEIIFGVLTTSFSRFNPICFLSMGLRQESGLCSSSSRKYP